MKKILILLVFVVSMTQANAQTPDKVITIRPFERQGNFYLKEFLKERPWIQYDAGFKKLVLDRVEGWTGYGTYHVFVWKNEETLADRTAQQTVESVTLYTFNWLFKQLIFNRRLDDGAVNVFFIKEKADKVITVFVYKDCPESWVWHVSATTVPGSFVGKTKYYSVGDYDGSGFSKTP